MTSRIPLIHGPQGTTTGLPTGRLSGTIKLLKGPSIQPGAQEPEVKTGELALFNSTVSFQIRRRQTGNDPDPIAAHLDAIAARLTNPTAHARWKALGTNNTPLSEDEKSEFTKISCSLIRKSAPISNSPSDSTAIAFAAYAITVIKERARA